MIGKTQGLYAKYHVERTDGKAIGWCFVLQDTDPFAIPALLSYAEAALESGNQSLFEDLVDKVQSIRAMQLAFNGVGEA